MQNLFMALIALMLNFSFAEKDVQKNRRFSSKIVKPDAKGRIEIKRKLLNDEKAAEEKKEKTERKIIMSTKNAFDTIGEGIL